MAVVAVAGGTGDFGRLIVEAIVRTGKHKVYILSRSESINDVLAPTLVTAYDSVPALTTLLTTHAIGVVICAFSLHSEVTSAAQVNLILAAERSHCTTRFLPSEFNVDYALPDTMLPYADKRFHLAARAALEQQTTTLEYSYVYTGMFMDYFGIPNVDTPLRELPLFLDPRARLAILPGNGSARMSMSYTYDAARYVAAALDVPAGSWARSLTTHVDTVSLRELVHLAEARVGMFVVSHQDVGAMLEGKNETLPRAAALADEFPERFPRGAEQVQSLIGGLEVSVALGAYDLDVVAGSDTINLVGVFRDKLQPPMTIGQLMEAAWRGS